METRDLDENTLKEKILFLARQHGARSIRMFGAVARGKEKLDSDIDFLVNFPPGYDLFFRRIALQDSLA
ncbi:nucleotidyltransferase family protein [Synechococcus sp. Nb3U1]|uniref:nucleotidyltransferase family protein n=1 Tax=Synechococcus sp. Nb3U1 TaxID=1914529 RepID=UPI003FCCA877